MKQAIYKFLLLTLLAMVGVINAAADECYLDGICYNLDASKKTAEVRKNDKEENTGSIVIPSKITYKGAEYSVTSIGWCAFQRCSGLTSVTIPESVTSIGGSAFNGCSGLKSLTIPESVTSIGDHAFSGCSKLTSVKIPSSVTTIESGAFSGCSILTSITIPEGVTSIGVSAFRDCI